MAFKKRGVLRTKRLFDAEYVAHSRARPVQFIFHQRRYKYIKTVMILKLTPLYDYRNNQFTEQTKTWIYTF
jgi:hypothetical protein